MTDNRYPPAYLRYLKARLINLGNPQFWGTAILLCVVGLIFYQSWSNPQLSKSQQNNGDAATDNNSSLSEEDKAIAADIDNLPSLFAGTEPIISPTTEPQQNDDKTPSLNPSINPSINPTTKPLPVDGAKPNLTSSGAGVVTPPAPTSGDKSVFISQAEDLLRFGASNNDKLLGYKPLNESSLLTGQTTNSSVATPGLVNQINQSQTINSTNPLPTALQQSSNQTNNQTFPSLNNITTGKTSDRLTNQPLPVNQTFSNTTNTGLNSRFSSTQPNPNTNLNNNQTVIPNGAVNPGANYVLPNNPNTNLNNNQTVIPNGAVNPGANYIQPSSLNNLPNNQSLQNQTPSVPAYITGTSPIIGPYRLRNPKANPVTITTPKIPSNYGNSVLQQPTQVQPINGLPNNTYPSP